MKNDEADDKRQRNDRPPNMRNGRLILVVDDNDGFRHALGEMQEQDGWRVTLCPDGAAAIQSAAHASYDVVLIDFAMPGIRGPVVTETLRMLDPRACIIGISFNDRKQEFLSAGADAFLQKPFDPSQVGRIANRQM